MQEYLGLVVILSRCYAKSRGVSTAMCRDLAIVKNSRTGVYDDRLEAIVSELRMKDGANYGV